MEFELEKLELDNVTGARIKGPWSSPAKKTNSHCIIWVFRGRLIIEKNKSRSFTLHEKALAYIPAGNPYRLSVEKDISAEHITIRFNYHGRLPALEENSYPLTEVPHLCLRIHQLLIEHRFKDRYYEQRQVIGLADLLIGLYRLRQASPVISSKLSAGTAKAINFVHARLGKPLFIRKMAEEAGYSLPYFCLLFKKETGYSPKQYIMHARIRRAKDMLVSSSLNFSEISQRCGYRDLFDFSRHFKKAVGLSPTDFRKSARI
jgi:AraC-like DNA-binding protein